MENFESRLKRIISDVPEIVELLEVLEKLELPNHYLAGGAVTQVVWNALLGFDSLRNVKDFDVIYFEGNPIQSESVWEAWIQPRVSFSLPVDVKNQALVHQWYCKKFGNPIAPLKSVEEGIKMWLPCFAVGATLNENGIEIYSPFGLEDLFAQVIRPNKTAMSKKNYDDMNRSFKNRWPSVRVIPW